MTASGRTGPTWTMHAWMAKPRNPIPNLAPTWLQLGPDPFYPVLLPRVPVRARASSAPCCSPVLLHVPPRSTAPRVVPSVLCTTGHWHLLTRSSIHPIPLRAAGSEPAVSGNPGLPTHYNREHGHGHVRPGAYGNRTRQVGASTVRKGSGYGRAFIQERRVARPRGGAGVGAGSRWLSERGRSKGEWHVAGDPR
jgi:hypothetical protein